MISIQTSSFAEKSSETLEVLGSRRLCPRDLKRWRMRYKWSPMEIKTSKQIHKLLRKQKQRKQKVKFKNDENHYVLEPSKVRHDM